MYLEYRDVTGNLVQLPLRPDIEPITIGRNPGSSVYSKESTVSRNHGRIGWDEEGYYIKDLGSSNGTFINGERTRRAVIREGDVVRCGEVLEIHAKSGEIGDSRSASEERPRPPAQKAMPTSGLRPDDSVRLAAAVAARQAPQSASTSGSSPAVVPAPPPAQAAGVSTARRAPPVPAELVGGESRPAAPRSTVQTGQRDAVVPARNPTGQGAPVADAAEMTELRRKVRALEQALADAEARATRAEKEAKESEPRAMRYAVELEGISDKYVKLKEQNQVITRSLEETRRELRQREDDAFEAERRVTELEQQIGSAREKATEATEQLSGLKVRLTQKDRQIEELQRQLDLLEYELRAARDENESLQTSFNREGGDVDRLERKINLLQEVIQEKESLIEQLRIDLRDKDIEIRQVRMGVGISDLEHEKRRLLEDYHAATRRVDELNDRLLQQSRQIDGLRAEVEASREATERKPAPLVDVSEHPDFKAKVRETERLREELSTLQRDLAKSELKLEAVQADSSHGKKLEAELALHLKKIESLEAQLRESEDQLKVLATTEVKASVSPQTVEAFEALVDAVAASKSNAILVRRYAQQLEKSGVGQKSETGEAIDMMNDIAIVLAQDLIEQERMVVGLRHDLGADGPGDVIP
ncbi:MAG: FHA domain-containing protein [Myxococcota bacterium]